MLGTSDMEFHLVWLSSWEETTFTSSQWLFRQNSVQGSIACQEGTEVQHKHPSKE